MTPNKYFDFKNFKEYCHREVSPLIPELSRERASSLQKYFGSKALMLLLWLAMLVILFKVNPNNLPQPLNYFWVPIQIFILISLFRLPQENFSKKIITSSVSKQKDLIYPIIFSFFDRNLKYSSQIKDFNINNAINALAINLVDDITLLTKENYLYNDRGIKYKAEDYLQGKCLDYSFDLYELDVFFERFQSYVFLDREDLFKGIALSLNMNRTINDHIIIKKKDSNLIDHKYKYIETGHPEFEDFFDTYASGESEIESILNDKTRTAILDFVKQHSLDNKNESSVEFAFKDDKLYVFIEYYRDFCHIPPLHKKFDLDIIINQTYAEMNFLMTLLEVIV